MLRPVKTCLLFFQLYGAFYAAECVRPDRLIVFMAKVYNAKYIVLGKKRDRFGNGVSRRVSKNKPAGCEVCRFKIPKGWKAGEPTISARDPVDSPEPELKSPRRHLMLSATLQSKSPLGPQSPLGPPEAAASTQLVPSPETLPA